LKSIIAYLWVICLSGANALFGQVTHSVLAAEGSLEPVNGNEPSIAVDPTFPNRTLIGVNTSTVMRSMDPALKLWNAVVVNPPQGFYGDPVFKINDKGNVY
jgi:hypothetical protein